jgi:hypothetical protein
MQSELKRKTICWIAIGLICLAGVSAQAQLLVGGGIRIQNDVPYTMLILQSRGQVAELSWATSSIPVVPLDAQLRVTARILSVLIRWQINVQPNFSIYPTLGGVVAEAIFDGWAGQKPVNAYIKGEGIQGGIGALYRTEHQPLQLFGSVLYTLMPLPYLALPNGSGIDEPMIGGITPWSWTVGVQYTFDLSGLLETLDNQ